MRLTPILILANSNPLCTMIDYIVSKSKWIFCFLFQLFTGCGGGGDATVGQPTQQKFSVEVNGDSIVVGPTLSPAPLELLARLHPDWEIVNKAVLGLTLHSLVNGYSTPYDGGAVPESGPQSPFAQVPRQSKVVVIAMGGNDAYSNYSLETFENDLRNVVTTLKSEGRIVVLTGIVKLVVAGASNQATVDLALEMNTIIRRVATDMGAIHGGWDEVEFAGVSETIDGIHRTQEASNRLVLQLSKTLSALQ
jgi:lysophospholipase L1-like esterase